jgi:hypothetical protein
MARRTKHYFLAPMESEEFERCVMTIYADRQESGNPYRWLADDWHIDFETVIAWGNLIPIPPEIACGLRVRAATMSGELPDLDTTVLSLMNLKLVLRWIRERASGYQIAQLFSEFGSGFYRGLKAQSEGVGIKAAD